MSLKRSTDDRVIAYNQRNTRRWCGGVVGREHAFDLADAYARDACWMRQRYLLNTRPWAQGEPSPGSEWGESFWRGLWVVDCDKCGQRRHFKRDTYLRGDYDDITLKRD